MSLVGATLELRLLQEGCYLSGESADRAHDEQEVARGYDRFVVEPRIARVPDEPVDGVEARLVAGGAERLFDLLLLDAKLHELLEQDGLIATLMMMRRLT